MGFNLKTYKSNEAINDHTENAVQLVMLFGTQEELKVVKNIEYLHKKQGDLTCEQVRKMHEASNKYYSLLKKMG